LAPKPDQLGVSARAFARQYVALVDALVKEGVSEATAREEARMSALILTFEGVEGEACPLCGRGGGT